MTEKSPNVPILSHPIYVDTKIGFRYAVQMSELFATKLQEEDSIAGASVSVHTERRKDKRRDTGYPLDRDAFVIIARILPASNTPATSRTRCIGDSILAVASEIEANINCFEPGSVLSPTPRPVEISKSL